ncbi:hypothetical protein [Demequina aestuarii]|uniref:hypothetical protein n=1 Tax=Demequina aestuarii TaxID=327095 RepID=UPI000784B574|nr:hypothetical protein [Demequina aestuarii]
MIDVTTWTAHATREPSDGFLAGMDSRWRESLAGPDASCVWYTSPLHALALAHADRATHRRRLRTVFVAHGHCELEPQGHGFTPMSELIPHDQYGPETITTEHTGGESPLAHALVTAMADPNVAVVTVFTEEQFIDVDSYDAHSSSNLQPERHGVVIPFLYASADESDDDAFEREDLLRANGFASYTVDMATIEKDPISAHRDMAVVLEDVFDEVSQLKADAAARILTQDPLWPLIVVRAPSEWNPAVTASARRGAAAA